MNESITKPRRWGVLLLLVSAPTLICCALPIVLISLGFGATVASLYSEHLPFLQWFGFNSTIVFSISFGILALSGWVLFKSNQSCPADPALAKACNTARKWNKYFWYGASILWVLGAFMTFVLPILIQ